MKIAIIGAGFSGLATCYHLLKSGKYQKVVVYDRKGIGAGASGMAAGLLHPYSGPRAKMSFQAPVAMKEALELLRIASEFDEVASFQGILRPAVTEEQLQQFSQCQHADTEWWDEEKIKACGLHITHPALFIRSGVSVYTIPYLQSLWKACHNMGAELVIQNITSVNDANFDPYDHVIVCTGGFFDTIDETKKLTLRKLKGQILQLEWPNTFAPLTYPLVSDGYLVASKEKGFCFAGATFEREFTSDEPDRKRAEEEIRNKLKAMSSKFHDLAFVDVKASLRAYTKNKLPCIARLNEKRWLLSGMGSKGLLYHAWTAKLITQAIIEDSLTHIPKELLM